MARFNFSTTDYDDFGGGDFEPIPKGEYEMMCEEAEEKTTASGGIMIKAKFRVLGPTNANRIVFNNFNIINNSEKAQEIGRRQLSTWARACGRPNAADTDELLNIPFIGVVDIEKGDDKYGPQNRLNGFKPKGGSSAPAPKSAPAPTQSAPAPVQPAPAPSTPASASHSSGKKKAPWDD